MAEEEKIQPVKETELCESIEVKYVTEKRVVKLTPKGLLEKISLLEKQRKSAFDKLNKIRESIVKLLGDKIHLNEVETEFNNFNVLCENILQVHKSLLGLLPTEASKHDIWYQAKMLSVNEFIACVTKWLLEVKQSSTTIVCVDDGQNNGLLGQIETQTAETEINNNDGNEATVEEEKKKEEDDIGPHDSISNVPSHHHGSVSSSSSHSSTSSAARRLAEAERDALLARAAALKDKHALEEQEFILKRKKEQLKLDRVG